MKNKEIDKRLKDSLDYEFDLSFNERKELLSRIEQLEKRNKELYEGFMATQEELTDYATKNEQLEKENKILRENAEHNDKVVDKVNWEINVLKHNRDKALKFIKERHGDVDIYIINLIHSILYDLKNLPQEEINK